MSDQDTNEPTITSPGRDGWTGRACQNTACHRGEVESRAFGRVTCGSCGGTGEEYRSELDEREHEVFTADPMDEARPSRAAGPVDQVRAREPAVFSVDLSSGPDLTVTWSPLERPALPLTLAEWVAEYEVQWSPDKPDV